MEDTVVDKFVRLEARISPAFDWALSAMNREDDQEFDRLFIEHVNKWLQQIPFITITPARRRLASSEDIAIDCREMSLRTYYYEPNEPQILWIQKGFVKGTSLENCKFQFAKQDLSSADNPDKPDYVGLANDYKVYLHRYYESLGSMPRPKTGYLESDNEYSPISWYVENSPNQWRTIFDMNPNIKFLDAIWTNAGESSTPLVLSLDNKWFQVTVLIYILYLHSVTIKSNVLHSIQDALVINVHTPDLEPSLCITFTAKPDEGDKLFHLRLNNEMAIMFKEVR